MGITKQQYKEAQMTIKLYEQELEILKRELNSNPDCVLNRLPKNCNIIQHTSFKSCDGCGHNKKEITFNKK